MELIETYQREWDKWMLEADPRVADWPLMSSPIPTMIIVFCYVVGIRAIMAFMKNREPVSWLKPVLIIYNLGLVLLSAWMVYAMFYNAYLVLGFSFACNNVLPYDMSEGGVGLAWVLYIFWLSKFLEFCDTIFMALKKRNNQISFLHTYHHVSMPLLWWLGIKFAAGGDSYWSAMLNCAVHVIMYTYYFLAAIGYNDIWWKHYLTQLQMSQFLFNMCFSIYSVAFNVCGPEYTFYEWMRRYMAIYMFSLLVLFGKFYIDSYLANKNRKPIDKKEKKQ